MAAHLEGKGLGMIDMAGLAQKGGAVYSHVQLAPRQDDIHAIRVAAGQADLVLGCDLVVTGSKKVLAAVKRRAATALVVNTAEVMPGDFARNADFSLPAERLKRAIAAAAGGRARTDRRILRRRDRGRDGASSAMPSPPTCSCWATPGRSGRVPLSRDAHPARRSSSTAKPCR